MAKPSAAARERREEEEEEEFRRKNLPTFNFAMVFYSCIILVGLLASPPQRRFRHVAGILSFLLLLKSSLTIAHIQLDLGWFDLVISRKSFMVHVTSSLLLLLVTGTLLALGPILE